MAIKIVDQIQSMGDFPVAMAENINFSDNPDSAKLKSQPLPKCAKIWYNKGKRIAEKTAPERWRGKCGK